jgi:hypothetical protein
MEKGESQFQLYSSDLQSIAIHLGYPLPSSASPAINNEGSSKAVVSSIQREPYPKPRGDAPHSSTAISETSDFEWYKGKRN